MRLSKYKELNDEKWLRLKYEGEKLSTAKIARLIGAKTPNSVRQALLNFGINVRSVSDGLTCNRIDDGFKFDWEVINGCLLGDGGLRIWNRESGKSYPCFCKKNKYYDHIAWVGSLLFTEPTISEEWSVCNGRRCNCFKIRSLCHKELLPTYRSWYPEDRGFAKSVPHDLVVTSTVLLHWFLDDGYAGWRVREGKKTKQVRMIFCSESFTKEDQEMLCEKVNFNFDLSMRVVKYKEGTGWRIKVPQSRVSEFYKIVGSAPVPSLVYKWRM